MASVKIVYRKDKLNKKNEAPIHFRIIKDRKITYISSGYIVKLEDWDELNKKIKGSGKGVLHKENVARKNANISKKYSDIEKELIDIDTQKKVVSSKHLKEIIFAKKPQDFYSFAETIIKAYQIDGKIGTYHRTTTVINKLKEYKPYLSFNDITVNFLMEYENYLKTKEKPNSINTVHANLKFIRLVFNRAIDMDMIDYNLNPFLKFKMKTEKTQKQYLTEDELGKVSNVETEIGSALDLHKDIFVFTTYVGGLRISDMIRLQWKNFDGVSIYTNIGKSKTQLAIKLPNKALEILNKYKKESSKNNDYIFNVLKPKTYELSEEERFQEVKKGTSKINKSLKEISKRAKIEKNLSTHIARHTFATRALTKGISIDKVSKLMAHANIKETQIYAKIINAELNKAMDVFND